MAARGQCAAEWSERRIGVLMGWGESDPEYRTYLGEFFLEMARLGRADGRDLHVEQRLTNAEFARITPYAKELVELKPGVILCGTTPVTAALHRETSVIPIVFAVVSDPVGAGLVASLSRPGGNITGFINEEAAMGGKWLGLLKEIAPAIKRAAIMFNPDTAPGGGNYFLGSFEAAARTLAVESMTTPVRSDRDIEAAISRLGSEQSGLVVMTESFMGFHRAAVIASATRYKVPSIMDIAAFARDGGLIGYGADNADLFRREAGYVDRILRGSKPADLPVQVPTRFNFVINLKTARALGLTVPATLLAITDEVVE
jgi:putative ABC transport system substrate-binding protein